MIMCGYRVDPFFRKYGTLPQNAISDPDWEAHSLKSNMHPLYVDLTVNWCQIGLGG